MRHGTPPLIINSEDAKSEEKVILDKVQEWLAKGSGSNICIVARKNSIIDNRLMPLLEDNGIDCVKLDGTKPERELGDGVRVATMHRVKGLEFPNMILASINKHTVPMELEHLTEDEGAHTLRERCLFYVAVSRARDELVVSSFGEPSVFLS